MCLFSESCRAPVMADGYCYQHSPNVPDEEKQRNRAKGGRNSRKVEVWNVPGDIQDINDLWAIRSARNSLFKWLMEGFISPAQAAAGNQILNGQTETIAIMEVLPEIEKRVSTLEGKNQRLIGAGENDNSD